MSPDQERRLEEIFSAARDLPPLEQVAFLDRACADDAELRRQVNSLLQAHEEAGRFLQPTVALSASMAPVGRSGDRIGRYKLLEQIGEGGFGVVWMAEQEEPVRRRVALKIIKLGMDTREVVARFEAERQALAMMDHPNIASIFDGGATDTGRPYFVMELVKGVPITDYCDANRLSTRERLELFMQVCQAVQHAHQKGVIHRDLKPSNILVTVKDDRPVPKVIDFGVAKATQARLTEKTIFTRFHQWIGTPAYMSPEQAGLGSLDVDTRSDIYSLGVLLYELLTGHTPFDTQKLLAAGYDAVMRTIREVEPPKPSTRLSTLKAEELGVVAAQRGSDPAKLNRLVHGDLDWIVMKALEKDRIRRYETASDFARDIQRHLGSEPVSAAAPGLVYRARKFVRRNRPRLAFVTLAVVAVALAVAALKFAQKSAAERQDLLAKGTNTVFTFARSDAVKALGRLLEANRQLVNQHDADGWTPLAYAASAGSTNALRLLLAHGAVMDATNYLGYTPLLEAASRGRASAVAALLAAGSNPNHVASRGVTALLLAGQSGSVEVGRLLLEKGAQTEATFLPAKTTPLQQAAMFGHPAFAELLLAHGARTDCKTANGDTPLHLAAVALGNLNEFRRRLGQLTQNGSAGLLAEIPPGGGDHRRVAELLLAWKADLEATDNLGFTPLLLAAHFTNCPVAEVLVAHWANLNRRGPRGVTPLAAAAEFGDAAMAALLLGAGANPNVADDGGFTPLHTAVENGHRAVVTMLLDHKADPNLACPDGRTSLHDAAGRGDMQSMRLLLDYGAAIHPSGGLSPPLSWAVATRQRDAVKFLLQQGAKADVPAQSGVTSLHWAAALGHPNIAKLLLEAGASVDANTGWLGTPLNAAVAGREGMKKRFEAHSFKVPKDEKPRPVVWGSDEDYVAVLRILLAAKANVNARLSNSEQTPIFMAVSWGNVDAVDLLLAGGADLRVVDRSGLTPLHAASEMDASASVMSNIVTRLLKAGASLDARDTLRGTPLHRAANEGKLVMVALLLEAGARVNAVGPNLCTPLQLAVMKGHRDVAKLLLSNGADLHRRDKTGATALHYAVALKAKELVGLLLDHGADVNALGTTNGLTSLMISAGNGDLDTMRLLLKRGAQVNAIGMRGWTALIAAAAAGRVDAAKLLRDGGANLEAADQEGTTVFMRAAKAGQLEMVKLLLDWGALITARDKINFTALHEAADRGHAEVVEFLLKRGMKVDLRDDYQSTPLHLAAQGAYRDEVHYAAVIKILLKHGADVNGRMQKNQTPLHRAAVWGRPQLLQVLLAAGANPKACDSDGKTALDLATATEDSSTIPRSVGAGRKKCAELLRHSRQKETGDGLSPTIPPGTNPLPEKVPDNRRAVSGRAPLATVETKADRQTLAELRIRAEKGDAKAQDDLADCYRKGEGVAKDAVEAAKWYRKGAEQNYAKAQYNLGLCYAYGEGVAKDEAAAVRWLRKAANQNDAKAQHSLGACYERGDGVVKDQAAAVSWYRKAAEQNSALSQHSLGVCYFDGQGVATNHVEAVRWFRKAAEQNYAWAQFNLGNCYAKGQGVSQDYLEAVKWFRKAADQDDVRAQYSLGKCYREGEGVAQDAAESVKWYRKAAEQNDAWAQQHLGMGYANGQGVAKDEVEALKWFLKAAEQGLAEAQHNLGVCYREGRGVATNDVEAVRWFRKAAEQNYALSQLNLGISYVTGQGLAKDEVEGYKWFLLAAAQGDTSAKHNAAMLKLTISREQIAEGKRRADVWLEERKRTPLRTR